MVFINQTQFVLCAVQADFLHTILIHLVLQSFKSQVYCFRGTVELYNCFSTRTLPVSNQQIVTDEETQQKKGGSQLFPTMVNVSRRSDEKKRCVPPPFKMSLFGLFLLQQTKFTRTKIHTPDVHSMLTWLTFRLCILFEYKKIDTCVEKAPNGAKL